MEWQYAENARAICPEGCEVAIETDTRELANVRCVRHDVQMDIEIR